MFYSNIQEAIFLSRPNRFIAEVLVNGQKEIAHVKNTGRCKEILLPNSKVYVQEFFATKRKTKYDLIAVYKGETLVNIDSQAPNKVFAEYLPNSELWAKPIFIKPEAKYKKSRFDFYFETEFQKSFVEVKGVTLEENGLAMFPDAPTERGVKHVYELCECMEDGYVAYLFFIIQMQGIKLFKPNRLMQKEFAEALVYAKNKGLNIHCLDCQVQANSLTIDKALAFTLV